MAKNTPVACESFASPGDWSQPDLRLLNNGTRPAPSLPLECFGAAAPIIKGLASSKASPPDYVAASLLVAAAGLIGASRSVRLRPNWEEPSVLWSILVGAPSAGKSPALAAIKDAVDRVERAFASDQRPARLTADDATVEALARLLAANPRGLVLLLDELAGMIGNWGKYSGGEGDAAFYLRAFSGAFGKIDRVTSGSINASRAYLSIVGGIQPDRFKDLVLARTNDGLVSRFLSVWPDPIRPQFYTSRFDEACLDHVFGRLVALKPRRCSSEELTPRRIPFTAMAQAEFEPWYTAQAARASSEAGFIAEFLGKSLGVCARIALVLEHLDWAVGDAPIATSPRKITPASIERACILMDSYFEPMARRVYADTGLPAEERAAVALLKALRRQREDSFNARQVQRSWGVSGIRRPEDIDAACNVLVDAGCIRGIENDKTGRRAKNFSVNPRIFT